jgi:hypothetical protein
MSYLYGDSTPSTLKINFIDFVRDAIECAVQVLVADRHVREGGATGSEMKKASEAEIVRLEALGALVSKAIDGATLGEAASATARCAEALVRSSADLVHVEIERVRAHLRTEIGQLDAQAARERAQCVQALGALLLKHDLPDWTVELRLFQHGGTHYSAQLHAKAPFGLDATVDLEIPPSHLMAHVVHVNKLVPKLEVQAPEAGGWLRKEVKLRPQHLEKDFVTELRISESETTIKLRTNADGSGAGCDLTMRPPRVLFVRSGDNDPTPFELADADAARVIELSQKLSAACADLMSSRKEVLDARLDGTPLAEHADPKLLAERLIETITPTMQEIAKRSLSPTELVLKRQLDSGRREEIFISRDELKKKLEPLDDNQRVLFVPIGLADLPLPAPPVGPPAPWRPAPSASYKGPVISPAPAPEVKAKAEEDDEDEVLETTIDRHIPALIDDTPVPVAKPK